MVLISLIVLLAFITYHISMEKRSWEFSLFTIGQIG